MDILKEAQHSLVGSMVDRTRYVNTGPLNEFKKVPEPTKKSKKYFPQGDSNKQFQNLNRLNIISL